MLSSNLRGKLGGEAGVVVSAWHCFKKQEGTHKTQRSLTLLWLWNVRNSGVPVQSTQLCQTVTGLEKPFLSSLNSVHTYWVPSRLEPSFLQVNVFSACIVGRELTTELGTNFYLLEVAPHTGAFMYAALSSLGKKWYQNEISQLYGLTFSGVCWQF